MCAQIKPFDTNNVESKLEMYFHRKPVTQQNSEIAMRETSRELKMILWLFNSTIKKQIINA